ncbi:MAG: hypothetical protein IJ272_04910 [Clostridia bacterium]|nr:hypothetical protein [Clostridia bacterium]
MRQPTVENKYNLTPNSITMLQVNREKVNETYFWRNNVVHAWCVSGNTAKSAKDHEFGTYNSFWLGVYDEDCKEHAGEISLTFSAYGDMCKYIFDSFYDFSTIEYEIDLEIQEKFLAKINHLIDEGVFTINNLTFEGV